MVYQPSRLGKRHPAWRHRPPSLDRRKQEQRGSFPASANSLRRERQRLAAQGRSLCLTQGIGLRGEWWKAPLTLPDWLEARLAVWRQLITAVETPLETLTQQVEALAPKERPKGLGR